MKSLHVKILLSLAAVFLVAAIAQFTRNWKLQWDVVSGQERYVSSYFGLPGAAHSQEATVLSRWRAYQGADHEWIDVAARPKINGLLVNWCHVKIRNCMIEIGNYITDADSRSVCAEWILADLVSSRNVCDTARRCERFRDELGTAFYDSIAHERSITKTQIRTLWEQSESAQ